MNSIAKRYAKLKLKQDIQVMREQKRIEKMLNFGPEEPSATQIEIKHRQELIEELIVKQNNLCPICGDNLRIVRPNLDHCHRTNMIRGVLCNSCNVGLGFFADNPKFLEAAITYLNQEHNIVNNGYCKVSSH